MKLTYSKHASTRLKARMKNKARIRKKLSGTAERPRLAVFRSNKFISAQLIDDVTGNTLAASTSKKIGIDAGKSSRAAAKSVGEEIAKKAIDKKIIIGCHWSIMFINGTYKNLINTVKAAILGTTEKNNVTGVGEPSYTSGAHI